MCDNLKPVKEFFSEPIAQKALGIGLATGLFVGYLVGQSLKSKKKSSSKKAPKSSVSDGSLIKLYQLDSDSSMKRYIEEFGMFKQPEELNKIKHRTMALPDGKMLADPICTQIMALVASVANSRSHLEVGIYTGYNLLQQMLELKEIAKREGRADDYIGFGLDVTVGPLFLTRHHFPEAGIMSDKMKLMVQPGVKSMEEMLPSMKGKLDTIFIDADKANYSKYYEMSIELLRKGGVLFVDNVLWSGKVWEYAYENKHQDDEKFTKPLHELNVRVANDERVKACILPIGDGLQFIVKL